MHCGRIGAPYGCGRGAPLDPSDQNAAEAAHAAAIEVIVSLAQAAAQRLGPERRGLPDVPHEPAVERAADQPDQSVSRRVRAEPARVAAARTGRALLAAAV